jgi:hypothetical protein
MYTSSRPEIGCFEPFLEGFQGKLGALLREEFVASNLLLGLVDHMPSKCETLSSNPSNTITKKKRKKQTCY